MSRSLWSFVGAIAILSATLATSAFTERRHPQALAQPLATIPRALAGWQFVQDAPLEQSTLQRLVLTDYVSRVYSQAGKQLGLFIAYYAEQRSGESMHSPKHCLPGSGWFEVYSRPEEVPAGRFTTPLASARIARPGEQVTILAYGAMVPVSIEAAEQAAAQGVSAEVVDLRTLVPLDQATVLDSVR